MATTLRPTDASLVAGAIVLLCGVSAGGVVTREQQGRPTAHMETYRGWPDSIRLTNGRIDLVIVPAVGRVLRVGWCGGPNLLWENADLAGRTPSAPQERADWVNYGGDKLWPAPQARWSWPPDPFLDGSPHAARVIGSSAVEIVSPASPKLGIRFRRRIALHPRDPIVSFTNTIENVSDRTVEWSVWQVTQVDDPDYALIPPRAGTPVPYYLFPENQPAAGAIAIGTDRIAIRRNSATALKVGSNSPVGRVAALKGNTSIVLAARHFANGTYPDEGCSLEVYTNPDPLRYAELEVLSPIVKIAPGRSYTFRTQWTLGPRNLR